MEISRNRKLITGSAICWLLLVWLIQQSTICWINFWYDPCKAWGLLKQADKQMLAIGIGT